MKKFMRVVASAIIAATVCAVIPPMRYVSANAVIPPMRYASENAVIPPMTYVSENADVGAESKLVETKAGYSDLDWCACEVLDFLADLAKLELNKAEKMVKESDKDEALKTEALKNIEEAREVIADIKAEIAKLKQDIKDGKCVDSGMNDIEGKIKGDMSEATSKVSEMMTNF